ncbi:hypothetical protein LCGC14_1600130, partial [marine sediment metagenome]
QQYNIDHRYVRIVSENPGDHRDQQRYY